jgi:hypothetical protein
MAFDPQTYVRISTPALRTIGEVTTREHCSFSKVGSMLPRYLGPFHTLVQESHSEWQHVTLLRKRESGALL